MDPPGTRHDDNSGNGCKIPPLGTKRKGRKRSPLSKLSDHGDSETPQLSGPTTADDSSPLDARVFAPPQHTPRRRQGTTTAAYMRNPQRIASAPASATRHRLSKPGAYYVHCVLPQGKEKRTTVIPENCTPGQTFWIQVGRSRSVSVTCPLDCGPGSVVDVYIDRKSQYYYRLLKPAALTISPAAKLHCPQDPNNPLIGGAFPMRRDIAELNRSAMLRGSDSVRTYVVTIPDEAKPGKPCLFRVAGARFTAKCPVHALPGERIRIVQHNVTKSRRQLRYPMVVPIPDGVYPGERFLFHVGSMSDPIAFRCPAGKGAGDVIYAMLPVKKLAECVRLKYPKQMGGYLRTLRDDNLQFQWVRFVDGKVAEERAASSFDFFESAFVRSMTFMEGNDPRLRTGSLKLVPADQARVESSLQTADGRTLFSFSDIAMLQEKSLQEKHAWFLKACQQVKGNAGSIDYIRIAVRRDHLVQDSFRAVLSLCAEDLGREWRVDFLGENARDGGGPTKEWFDLVSASLINPDVGLFAYSQNNQAMMEINAASCKALIEGQLVKFHFTRLLYKHILGWPVTARDVTDEELYKSWTTLTNVGHIPFGLTFTTAEEVFGKVIEKELIAGGANVPVTRENLGSFLRHCTSYHLMQRTLPQLTEFLLGFYDVVPEPLLTVFDHSELELVLCGLPQIPVRNWKQSTKYEGLFQRLGYGHKTVSWFWDVVEEFDQEKRARLLQFTTGTSGVPVNGFQHLQGGDGTPKPFTIEGIDSTSLYPKAHTCFNKLDLPNYSSKDELRHYLVGVLNTSYIGYGIE